jgi:hypothetical protein
MASLKRKLERKWSEQDELLQGDEKRLKLRLELLDEILREVQAVGSNEDDTTQPEQ